MAVSKLLFLSSTPVEGEKLRVPPALQLCNEVPHVEVVGVVGEPFQDGQLVAVSPTSTVVLQHLYTQAVGIHLTL